MVRGKVLHSARDIRAELAGKCARADYHQQLHSARFRLLSGGPVATKRVHDARCNAYNGEIYFHSYYFVQS